jgi:hypothetical protein
MCHDMETAELGVALHISKHERMSNFQSLAQRLTAECGGLGWNKARMREDRRVGRMRSASDEDASTLAG